ncbi:MAG: aldo/keto reductase [Candidatus Kariarchaeaceae archaeon]|jgi:aryl-alcohol dehydrogenase-like predicted oxidoreductase
MMRKLGSKQVSAMGMGCWALGGPFQSAEGQYFAYGTVDDAESQKVLRRAIELGISLFDTADVYGTGHSEVILGSVLKDYDDVVIATKFGSLFEEGTRMTKSGHDASETYIRKAVADSQRRLQRDFIDLYQLHWWNLDLEPAVAVRDVLEALVEEGQIGGYGWSTDDPARGKVFAAGKHCLAMQFAMNLTRSNPAIVQLCEDHKLAGLIRGPLNYGLLTGKYKADSVLPDNHLLHGTNFGEGRIAQLREALEQARSLLTTGGRTLVQGSLGYLWAKSVTIIPIPGAKTQAQIEENATAMEFGPLSPDIVQEVDVAFAGVQTEFSGY